MPPGFRIEAMATGLIEPAQRLCRCPTATSWWSKLQRTGSEPVERPKDPSGTSSCPWRTAAAAKETAGATGGPPQRITLLRDANGDGKPELQTVLVDHLNSPFGVAVVGDDLYVADTDAILRYPVHARADARSTAPAVKVIDLPAGLIDHHWTKSLTASPDGSKLYAGVGSNSNMQERGPEAETNRAAIWEVDPDDRRLSRLRERACAIRTA